MARDKVDETSADTQVAEGTAPATETTATAAEGAAAAPAEAKSDERFRFVTRPGSTEQVKRKDYILELWQGKTTTNNPEGKKWSRGAIAKHLTQITGKTVPYQIVFAATKGVEGGPDKAAEEIPAGSAPAQS